MIIGICGGTGSGKTTVARRILENVSDEQVVYLAQDSYYRNLGDMPLELRRQINFDHPDAFDNDLFINHVRALKAGEAIEVPLYDYTTHTRLNETKRIEPKLVTIVEGILVFADPVLRELMDVKIFVDTADDLRFIRRLQRDVAERGRSPESVIRQYLETVRPMHLQFVEPSKRHADVVIPEGGYNEVGIDLISGKIRILLQRELAKKSAPLRGSGS
jgi:uridine kinase